MEANISTEEMLANLFRILGQAVRIQILLVIGEGSACVCHLEAFLGLRQAFISQHLMVLREAGLVETQREGRNIYYRLAQPDLLDLVRAAARFSSLDLVDAGISPVATCPCPHCNPDKTAIVCSRPEELAED